MSDSEDDLSTPANFPTDSDIEQCLRRVVRDAVKKDESISINLARTRVEKELGLEDAFFKENEVWKKRSKDVINQAVEDPGSPQKPKPKPQPKAGTKRKSDEAQSSSKRVKKSPVPDSEDRDQSDGDDIGQSQRANINNNLKKGRAQPRSEEESALSEPPEDESEPADSKQNGKHIEDDESELSSVIDEPPPKKGRQKKKKSSSPSATKSKPAKPIKSEKSTKSTIAKDLSPDEEEIKRLQSWLMKCGIRKVWHRELAPYPTAKEKIKHLKQMLDDVGMTPRYSAEKARQIKEARELKAELEAAREFNKQWGNESEAEEGKEETVVKRLKPKGLIDLSDSDEESD